MSRVAVVWTNRPFRQIILAHVGYMIGVGSVLVTTAYFARQVLHMSDAWLGWFFLCKTVGNLASVPVWLWLSKRFDKKRTYLAALVVFGLLNLSWIFAAAGEPIPVMFLRNFLIGCAMAGNVMLSYSVITDVMRHDSQTTGLHREGAFSGIVSFVDKAFQAAGVAIVGYLLSSMGYRSSEHGAHIQQSASALTAIYIGFSVIPALAALACILAMAGYDLKRTDFQATGPAD
jgi:GPH family glycoside/pentoside/hexuronide:cation symporter